MDKRCAWLAAAAAALTMAHAKAGPSPILLESALREALEHNRDLRILALRIESGKSGIDRAVAAFKPVVKPTGELGRTDKSTTTTYGLSVGQQAPWGGKVGVSAKTSQQGVSGFPDVYSSQVLLEWDQPLLRRLGPLVTLEPLRQAESQERSLRRELELRRTDLVIGVVEAYENLLSLQRSMEYEVESVARLDQVYRLMQARERQGRTTRVESLRAETKLGDARLRLKSAEENCLALRASFAELLGGAEGVEYEAVEGPRLAVEVPGVEAAVAAALTNRLDYAQLLQDASDHERGVRIARRTLLPDLSLITRYGREGAGASQEESARLDSPVWFVGLGAQVDLPDRQASLSLDEARLAEAESVLRLEAIEAAIGRQVRQALLAYRRVQESLPLVERNYQASLARRRLARRLFEMGRSGHDSLSDAEDEFRQAEEAWRQAQSGASIEAYRLLRVLGTLVEYPMDLKPGAVAYAGH